jgi:hypothetical protein
MPHLLKQTIEQRAAKLLEKLGVDDVPVPVERIAKALGAKVRFSPLADE